MSVCVCEINTGKHILTCNSQLFSHSQVQTVTAHVSLRLVDKQTHVFQSKLPILKGPLDNLSIPPFSQFVSLETINVVGVWVHLA